MNDSFKKLLSDLKSSIATIPQIKIPEGHVLSDYQKRMIADWTPPAALAGRRPTYKCATCGREYDPIYLKICGETFCHGTEYFHEADRLEAEERSLWRFTPQKISDEDLKAHYGFTRDELLKKKVVETDEDV